MNTQRQTTPVFLIGRLLMGGMYTLAGLQNLLELNVQVAHPAFQSMPFAPVLVACASLLLMVGGLSMLSGIRPRLGVAAIVLFLVPVTFIMHNFWTMEGMQQVSEMHHFFSNIMLIGGALLLVAIPQPWPVSLDSSFSAALKHSLRTVRYALSALVFGLIGK